MSAVTKEERRGAYPFVLVFVILSLGIVVGGVFYYRHYKKQFRAGIEQQLSAIAELKVNELVQYRKERWGDANIFFRNAAFSGLAQRFLSHPDDPEAQEQLRSWLAKIQNQYQYDRIVLLDARGVERISFPATAVPIADFVLRQAGEVLQSRKMVFQDFHRNEHNQQVYLTLLVPIFDGADQGRALGVLALRIDPETYLYPFIKRWPTPSRTAETLLVRRDGNDALFLNELKFGTNTALNLRVSLDHTNVPAVKAVLGQQGIVEGTDYRGAPVVAVLHAVPDSPWFLVARMDAAEAYAPLRERWWMIILLMTTLVLCAGAGAGAVWRHQRARFYQEQSSMIEALQDSEELLRLHTDNSPMAVIEWNADQTITRWTGAAEKIFGWSAKEAIGKPISEVPKIFGEDLPAVQKVIQQFISGAAKHVVSSNRNHTRSGRIIHCDWYSSVLRDTGGKMVSVLSQVLDVTERKRMDVALTESRNFLDKIINSVADPMFVKNREHRWILLNDACCEFVGRKREEMLGKSNYDFFPRAEADVFWAKDEEVFTSGTENINEEKFTDAQGKIHAIVTKKTLYTDEKGGKFLVGIISDITERKRAEEALRDSQALYSSLVEQLPVGVFRKDPAGRYVLVNPWFCRQKGMTAGDFLGKTPEQVAGSDKANRDRTGLAVKYAAAGGGHHEQIMQTGKPIEMVEEYLGPDGRKQFVHAMKFPVFDSGGKIIGTQGLLFDITEMKQASEALHREQALMGALLKTLPDPVYFKDTASCFLRVNPALARRFGLSDPSQVIGKTDKDFFTGEHAQKALADEQEIIRTGQPLVNIEEKETWPDGSETWVLTTKMPLRDDAGKIIGTCGISSNITKAKQAEEELRRTNEALASTDRLLQAMLDNIPDWIYFKDTQSRIVKIGRALAKSMGMANPEEAVGKTDFDFRQPDQAKEFYEDEQKIFRTGEPLINKTEKQVLANGETAWTSTTKVPLRDPSGKVVGLVGINRDITHQKQAEEELRVSREQLLRVVTQTRCILNYGHVEGPEGWRERALNPETPFRWNFQVQNEQTAQKILPLDMAPGERYQQAWTRSRVHADHAQMNWNSGNAFLNDLPFYRNEFRCTDRHGVGHWMQQFVTVRKLADNRWEVFGITTDISDLKRVETEARESQALYHSLVDQMPAGIFRKDEDGRYVFVNSTFCRLKEMTPDRFLGKTVLELGLADAALLNKGAGHHATIMQTGKTVEDDEVYNCADGETRNYHVVKSPVVDSAGKIVGTQGILFDITDRKRAEEGLEHSFQLQRGISWLHESLLTSRPLRDRLQLVTDTIVRLFDADFCRIWLTRPGDLCEKGCLHAQVTEGPHACLHRDKCLHLMASAGRYTHLDGAKHRRVPFGAYKIGLIASGKETKFLINDVQKNPQVHDREWAKELGLVSFAGYRLQSPWGAPLGVLALFAKRPLTAQEDVLLEGLSNATTSILLTQLAEDQTQMELIERKRAEEALRWSETQLHVILESTADGLLAVDSKGNVITANQRFAELWRIPQSLINARDDHALLDFSMKQLSDPDAFLKKVQLLYGTNALDMDTLDFKDGRVFERYSFPMMMDGTVIGRVWSFRDITGRKRQEKELNDKNAELERFTYAVSHDLKSPLVTVKTFLGYLEQDLAGSDKERVKQDVTYMHTAADRMSQLLDELLNLARIGRKMNPAERVTFKEVTQEAIRLVAGRISTGGAEVQVADAAIVLEGDRPRLIEIWQNLVENACKFMGNQPRPRVEIGVEQRGSETVFFVRDNGLGIDPRYQAKIFGLFEKLDPKGEGTGMGLTLIKRIVEIYKGRIWVESAGVEQGANFLFTLPGAVVMDPEQPSPSG